MFLSDLPADALLLIIRHLSIPDTLRLRQTCRTMCEATKAHAVWHNFLHSEIHRHNIAVSLEDKTPDSLSSTELEQVIVKALRLHLSWTSPSPIAPARYYLPITSEVKALHFYTHQTHQCLFSDSFVTPTERVIDCWDISSTAPTHLASRRIPVQASVSFNQDPAEPVIFTVSLGSHIELLGMDFSQEKTSIFVMHGMITAPGLQTRFLSGLKLISQQSDDARTLIFRDAQHPESQIALRSQHAEVSFLDAIMCGAFVIVLRSTTLGIYEIPSDPIPQLMPIVEEPLRQVYQGRLARSARHNERGAINILIKYSASPWQLSPANYIHHYTLFPNYSYNSTQSTSPHNFPYHFPATLTQTIGAPVRTLGFSDLPVVLGPFGTAIWVDNHIEDYYGPIQTGQRLASKILIDERDDDDLSDNVMAATMASTVYDVQQEDSWTCIAMDERAGRIAVGSKVGTCVLEYM